MRSFIRQIFNCLFSMSIDYQYTYYIERTVLCAVVHTHAHTHIHMCSQLPRLATRCLLFSFVVVQLTISTPSIHWKKRQSHNNYCQLNAAIRLDEQCIANNNNKCVLVFTVTGRLPVLFARDVASHIIREDTIYGFVYVRHHRHSFVASHVLCQYLNVWC